MAIEFKMPEMGENVDSAEVLTVLVAEGDVIAADQPVLEIETEKATVEVPSAVAGRVTEIHVAEGDTIKVGQVILTVDSDGQAEGETEEKKTPRDKVGKKADQKPARTPAKAGKKEDAPAEKSEAKETEAEETEADEAEREQAEPEEPEADEAKAGPAKSSEPVSKTKEPEEKPQRVATPEGADRPVFAAPSVRKFAREIGVDIHQVAGSGPGGRISEDDVKKFARQARQEAGAPGTSRLAPPAGGAGPAQLAPLPDFSKFGPTERERMSNVRRTTARHVAAAWSAVPHVTVFEKADITAVEQIRQQYKKTVEQAGGKLTITAILLKVAAAALKVFPRVNASFDPVSDEVVLKKYYDIGVAADTERGLVVPVIRGVDSKNIVQLAVELVAAAEKARGGKLSLDEMKGATFTLTNLGSLGTEGFTPIVNLPEAAILGVGRARTEPVWTDGQFEPRTMLPLSLSFDHRLVDGADGARFLHWIVQALERPLLLALEG